MLEHCTASVVMQISNFRQGWAKERVIQMPLMDGGRIVSVISSDPPAHRTKVPIKFVKAFHMAALLLQTDLGFLHF